MLAAIADYHRLGGLSGRNELSHGSGCKESKIRVPGWLVSGENSLLGLQMATLSLYPSVAFSRGGHTGVAVGKFSFLFIIMLPVLLK